MYEIPPERLKQEFKIWLSHQRKKIWIPKLYDLQYGIVNSFKRATLVCGPRKSGKTWGVLHKLIRHGWETRPDPVKGGAKGARVAMFSKTLKTSKDGGTWDDILKIVIPEWIANKEGFRFTTKSADGTPGPKVDGQTRTPFFRIANMHGGEAEFKLFSLDFDDDVENKVKEQRFSAIYFSELDKFKDRSVLSITLPQLRLPHLTRDEMFWIADTNPAEEGEDSWIYEVFYQERVMAYEAHVQNAKKRERQPMDAETFKQFQSDLALIEIRPEENPCLDPREIIELKSTYNYDADLYARYVEGKWVLGRGAAGRHFSGYFFEATHVLGDVSDANEDEWILVNPSPSSNELITGWDLGDVNSAAHIIDKVGDKNAAVYYVLDELVSIDEQISTEEFTQKFITKLDRIITTAGMELATNRCWSDRSSIERYSSTAGTYQHLQVHAASDGRIFLTGVPKGPESVRARVRVIKRLLFEKRLFVSAHCHATIAMLKFLRKGKDETSYVVQDKYKHPFDALSYALLMETSDDLENTGREGQLGKRPPQPMTSI